MKRFSFTILVPALLFVAMFAVTLASCGGDDGNTGTPSGNTPNDNPGGNNPVSGGDGLTITDIPARFNGKFIYFYGGDYGSGVIPIIHGCDSVTNYPTGGTPGTLLTPGGDTPAGNTTGMVFLLTKINNGMAVLPLWMQRSATWVKFTGSYTYKSFSQDTLCRCIATIYDSQNISSGTDMATRPRLAIVDFNQGITFTNGNATVSWNDGYTVIY